MKFGFSVHADFSGVAREKIPRVKEYAEHVLAEQMRKDTSPYVPMLTGSLDNRTKVEGNEVIYPGPYTRFLYYGKVMVDPNTGSTWAPAGGSKVVTDRNLVFTHDFHPQAQAFWCEASKAQNIDKWQRVAQKAVDHFGR
jgi:hypothetical protein